MEEDIPTFHITGSINEEVIIDNGDYLYINEAQIGPWGGDDVQIHIRGHIWPNKPDHLRL